MIRCLKNFVLCLLFLYLNYTPAQAQLRDDAGSNDSLNPVIAGDFADPSVIRIGNRYYAAGTSSEWAPHYPVYMSDDLYHWKHVNYIFHEKQPWMFGSFWAPELFYHNNKVYAYYTVRDTSGISCIGVASASDPLSEFTDHGVVIRTGKEAIDPFVFNDNGKLYISWKAYGLDKRPIELLMSRLSDDGLKLEGEIVSIKKDDGRQGLEGQSMINHNGYYYLFYSAGSCCGVPCSYNLRVSRSKSITGPFIDYEANPVLHENGAWMCTGHGTPVLRADGKWFYLFHAYNKESNVYTGRQGLLTEIAWNSETGWPLFKQPDSAVRAKQDTWIDEFNDRKTGLMWTWDFRHSKVKAINSNGMLTLSGETKAGNKSGSGVCVRTVSGNYEISTALANINNSLKGLVLYGDDNANTGIGIRGDNLVIWSNNNNKTDTLKTLKLSSLKNVKLKMSVSYGRMIRFFFCTDGGKWKQLPVSNKGDGLDVSYTKQWDRAPRPGLIHKGKPSEPAQFLWCRINSN